MDSVSEIFESDDILGALGLEIVNRWIYYPYSISDTAESQGTLVTLSDWDAVMAWVVTIPGDVIDIYRGYYINSSGELLLFFLPTGDERIVANSLQFRVMMLEKKGE